ncbi:TBC domain-containing protein C1778.09 [Trichoderma asperellum]|uniref:TBC domain-containing protein C1778.09 n=1 Tax=Trichoderma asperellum TaxID=101201 RepID=A0A6V8QJE7_TRIAP|nr:TBC domain-containing protein C1778.09 [Trichoderma asperellum]
MALTSIRPRSASRSRRSADTNLIGVRYEKTIQAEPPIPLPPRNTSRSTIRTLSIRSSASSPSPSVYENLSLYSPSLVVVAPPALPLPVVAPPTEEHPALRTPIRQAKLNHESWKRDSGHAPTPTSATTIYEEDCEEEEEEREQEKTAKADNTSSSANHSPPPSTNIGTLVDSDPVPPQPVPQSQHGTVVGPVQGGWQSSRTSPKRQSFLQRLSVCSSAPPKGKLGLVVDEGSPTVNAPPMQPLMRGSQPPPASTHKQPQRSSPGNAETSSLALRARVRAQAQTSLPKAASPAHEDVRFAPLGVSIPTDSLLEDDFMATLSFSNRGSIMFGGRRAGPLGLDGASDAGRGDAFPSAPSTPTHARSGSASAGIDRLDSYTSANASNPALRAPLPPPDIRVLTSDIEKESQKVRSLYGVGDAINWEDGARHSYCEPLEPTPELPAEEDGNDSRDTELAGGLEDWEDIDGASVDRYGFISAPRPRSRLGTPTEMKSAQFSPRRRLQKRELAGLSPLGPSRKLSARSLNTQNSEMSTASKRSSRSVIRQASNLLPHNRDRRWLDEAGDMLTLPPSLQDAAEEAQIERISETLKRKEWERSEKWRKMAKVVRKGGQGEGMEFEFDKKNPKLIERTWKGIPDRWRAAAWWSFLASSAVEHESYASEEDITSSFHHLLEQSSPDDVQIDLDVPRTISRHIMFRKRYRGGQRLLFRVLHCLSIYFPETGYVQGMASLAATLLCYFDEEKCFVMLVRMWQLRGLDRLYRPGFEGLMKALHEFDETWLNKDVAKRLTELSVDITAYGTRWYLTLFNLSIPFPAQLRVWDVFLLLGDSAAEPAISINPSDSETTPPTGLDILHATSAALVQALREVLLDSDFENAMKALTSWIPIKDEDLLMKVAKAEWKSHQGKKKT